MAQKPLRVKPHLSYKEINKRYRSCKNPVEKSRWNLIRLMANPAKSVLVKEATDASGFKERWARQLIHRYNQEGPQGLNDKRRNNQGQEPALNIKQKEKLKNILVNEMPLDGGLWTGPKVCDWIKQETGYRPSGVTAWNYLKNLGFSLQQPRTKHVRAATKKEQKKFKKN